MLSVVVVLVTSARSPRVLAANNEVRIPGKESQVRRAWVQIPGKESQVRRAWVQIPVLEKDFFTLNQNLGQLYIQLAVEFVCSVLFVS